MADEIACWESKREAQTHTLALEIDEDEGQKDLNNKQRVRLVHNSLHVKFAETRPDKECVSVTALYWVGDDEMTGAVNQ